MACILVGSIVSLVNEYLMLWPSYLLSSVGWNGMDMDGAAIVCLSILLSMILLSTVGRLVEKRVGKDYRLYAWFQRPHFSFPLLYLALLIATSLVLIGTFFVCPFGLPFI